MQFIPHPQHTRNLGAPIGWDHSKIHCGSLSISDKTVQGLPVMESHWRPEGREAISILLGAPIALGVYGQGHPPVSMHLADVVLTREELKARYEAGIHLLLDQLAADGFALMGQPLANSMRVKDLQA